MQNSPGGTNYNLTMLSILILHQKTIYPLKMQHKIPSTYKKSYAPFSPITANGATSLDNCAILLNCIESGCASFAGLVMRTSVPDNSMLLLRITLRLALLARGLRMRRMVLLSILCLIINVAQQRGCRKTLLSALSWGI